MSTGAATLEARGSDLGKVVVDGEGMTLYLFEKDSSGKSACSGACAEAWPPYAPKGQPKLASGIEASLVGTTKRTDGKQQVTLADHPLYYYAGDRAPGDTTGQGLDQFGAEWYVLSPSGKKVEEGEKEQGKKPEGQGKESEGGGGSSGY